MSEPQVHTRRKRGPELHRAILEAAQGTLEEVGYQRLTIEAVAARAGVAKATVYRWWPGKAALVIEALRLELGEPLRATGDTGFDIRAMVTQNFEMVRGMVGEVLIADLGRNPEAGRQLEELLGPYRAAHAAILLGAAGRGDLPYDIDAGKVIDLISGIVLVRKLMNRWLGPELIDELTDIVLAGPLPRISTRGR